GQAGFVSRSRRDCCDLSARVAAAEKRLDLGGRAAAMGRKILSTFRISHRAYIEAAMNKVVGSLIPLLLSFSTAYSNQFDKVRCGSDIPKALMGQRASNERVVVIEDRHKALGLKDLGADEISGRLSTVWWRICGAEYVLLEDDHVRDVLPFPSHSKDAPA